MIRRRRRLSSRLALAQGCLVLAWLATARADAAEAGHSHDADAHAVVAKPSPTPPVETPAAKSAPGETKTTKVEKTAHADAQAPSKSEAPVALNPNDVAAVPKRTNEVQSLLNLGASLTEREDYDAAEIAFYQVLNAPKASADDTKSALLGLAHMHRCKGTLTKAVAVYERFLKDFPADERAPDALLNLGRTLRSLGVYKAAIARFYSVINATLKLPGEGFDRYQLLAKTAQFEIAETHFLSGNYVEASKFYTRLGLIDLAPVDRARAHFKAGYSLRLQGNLEGAITTLRAYIEQWPADENIPEARYLLAVSLREIGRGQEAFVATLELLKTEKSRIETDTKRWNYWQRRTGNQLANDFFETGDIMNARSIYAGLLELSSDPTWRLPISYQLALCHERLGATGQAREAFQKIIDELTRTPQAEFTELATMAKWRIEHLEWREKTGQQVDSLFSPAKSQTSAPSPQTTPVAKTASTQ